MQVENTVNLSSQIQHTMNDSMLELLVDRDSEFAPSIIASVTRPLIFRDAFSVFNAVVNFDVQSKLDDTSSYDTWLRRNSMACEIMKRRTRKNQRDDSDELKKTLKTFIKENKRALMPYQKAQKRYLRYLYQQYLKQNYIVNPWFSVHPDELFFETFTHSQRLYCRLSLDIEILENVRKPSYGSAMLRYEGDYHQAIEKIRAYRQLHIKVKDTKAGPSNLSTRSLPREYIRGLLQLNTAMGLPMQQVRFKIIDLYNLLVLLEQHTKTDEEASLRFEFAPNKPVKIVLEPENKTLICTQTKYEGDHSITVRHWDRSQLLLLKRVLSVSQHWTFHFSKTTYPVFYVMQMDGASLTLGVSCESSKAQYVSPHSAVLDL